jgi:hypothetical protein
MIGRDFEKIDFFPVQKNIRPELFAKTDSDAEFCRNSSRHKLLYFKQFEEIVH